jgi:uncharacterized protein (TIGR02246 family)
MIEDRFQIEQLINRYAQLVDRHQAAAAAALFTEDGEFTGVYGRYKGRAAVEKFYADFAADEHTVRCGSASTCRPTSFSISTATARRRGRACCT